MRSTRASRVGAACLGMRGSGSCRGTGGSERWRLSHKGRGRARLLGGLDRINAVGTGFNLYSGVAFLIGIGFAIRGVAMTLAGTFGDNMDAPVVQGPVYGEMFAVFAIMMLLVLGGGMLAIVGSREFASGMMVVTEVLMWGCLAALGVACAAAWTGSSSRWTSGCTLEKGGEGDRVRDRGIPVRSAAHAARVGRRGVAGVDGRRGGGEGGRGGSPMFRPPGGSSWLAFTIGQQERWSGRPITEEIVFRGAALSDAPPAPATDSQRPDLGGDFRGDARV